MKKKIRKLNEFLEKEGCLRKFYDQKHNKGWRKNRATYLIAHAFEWREFHLWYPINIKYIAFLNDEYIPGTTHTPAVDLCKDLSKTISDSQKVVEKIDKLLREEDTCK